MRWIPPSPWKGIKAIAVDVEPEPFWNGADEVERIAAWRAAVNWQGAWGTAEGADQLNGSSGAWVDENVLTPFAVAREGAWITDVRIRCTKTVVAPERGHEVIVVARDRAIVVRA